MMSLKKISLTLLFIQAAHAETTATHASASGAETAHPLPTYNAGQGALSVLANIYQSCQVLDLPPLPVEEVFENMVAGKPYEKKDVLNDSALLMKGLDVVPNKLASGIGVIRYVSDASEVKKYHYYLRNIDRSIDSKECRTDNVAKKPPIFNYGGKPSLSGKKPPTLDMLCIRNASFPEDSKSCYKTNGVDCSGFVMASFMRAGLKVTSSQDRVLDSGAVSKQLAKFSTRYLVEPELNGMDCLETVKFEPGKKDFVKPGDILVGGGHSVVVTKASNDPFGLSGMKDYSECLAGNFNRTDFDFEVAQSSPVGGSAGAMRMNVRDFLDYARGFEGFAKIMAVYACKAHFKQQSRTASVSNDKDQVFSVIRHKTDNPACVMEPLKMVNPECTKKCEVIP